MKKAIIFVILILLLAYNVEAYHTTNKYGRYDDQHPKNHKEIITINNNYNIHDNIIIVNDRVSKYSRYNNYRHSNRASRYYEDRNYRYDRYDKDYRTTRYYHNKKYTIKNSRYKY